MSPYPIIPVVYYKITKVLLTGQTGTSEKKQIKSLELSARIENPLPLASWPGHKVMKMQLAGDLMIARTGYG